MSTQNTKFFLRMPQEMRDEIALIAEHDHRTMTGQILVMLERALKEQRETAKEQRTTS